MAGLSRRHGYSQLSTVRSGTVTILPQEALFNLGVDSMEPLLSAICPLLLSSDRGLQVGNALTGGAQLMGEFLLYVGRTPPVVFRNARRFVQQTQDRLTGLLDLIFIDGRLMAGIE
jgi:hypothetical protein